MKYLPRIVDTIISEKMSTFGALLIEGPKWCGKTMTASQHCKSIFNLGDPSQNFNNRTLARTDISLVLRGEKPRLIDEWQEVPPIWDAVRMEVDKSNDKGQFILTGSATPNRKGVLHTGAGRICRLKMRTMSLYESGDSSGQISLEALCNGHLDNVFVGDHGLNEIIELIMRGGWPANIGIAAKQAAQVSQDYIQAVIEDDVSSIDGVKRDTSKMLLLLRSLARNESTTATISTLSKDVVASDVAEIHRTTVNEYLDIFKRMFLTDNILPFSSELRSSTRLKKAEKRHLADPSLACALLRATPEKLLKDLNTLGFLFESLCMRDLRVYAESFDAHLYHYQDYNNDEIDAVIELRDGEWCAFEIKLGANKIDEAADNLLKIQKKLEADTKARAPKTLCVICGLTNAAYQRKDGVFVVPITALKN